MQIDRIFATITLAAAIGVGVSMLLPENALAVPAPTPLAVSTTPLPLNRDDPTQTSVGDLMFRGAVQVRSSDPLFGGISALRSGPGNQMLAVTDTGNWLAFDTVETAGRLTGIANAILTPILQPDGKPVAVKADGDAEALEWNPATGAATIVYEQDHRLAHFTGITPQNLAVIPTSTERLTQMTGWPLNGGGEAMAQLPDGTRLILAETTRRSDGARTALLTRNGKTTEIGIQGVPDHSPTDAVALDATRILILHRRFDLMGVGAAISLVDLAPALGANATALGANPSATLPARVIARWQPPQTLDNMEGLAIRRDGDRVFLYVVSDDNLNSIQRTLLMKFELSPSAFAPSP
nr:esterase-like activity of phytase family protein [Polymorphobacter sp.]